MMLRAEWPQVLWKYAVEVFNNLMRMFFDDAVPHTAYALEQAIQRNHTRFVLWNHFAGDAGHKFWREAIRNTLREIEVTPTIARVTPAPTTSAYWTYDMKLVLHLVQQDTALALPERTKILNALSHNVLARWEVAGLSEEALSGQYSRRPKKNEQEAKTVTTEDDVQGPPAKRECHRIKNVPSATENWEFILSGSEVARKAADIWKPRIEAQKGTQTHAEGPVDPDQRAGRWQYVYANIQHRFDAWFGPQ
jgi:hypothetical protein